MIKRGRGRPSKASQAYYIDPGAEREPIVWGYARVSRDDQNLGLQIDALAGYGVLPSYLVEEKISGSSLIRPEFDRLIGSLRSGDTLVCWKLDRLGRSALRVLEMAEKLEKMKVRVVILTMGIDSSTPAGKLVFGIFAQLAEFERAQLIERTNAGLDAARKRGVKLGRKAALKEETKVQAYRMHMEQGLTVSELAKIFNVSRSVMGRCITEKNQTIT